MATHGVAAVADNIHHALNATESSHYSCTAPASDGSGQPAVLTLVECKQTMLAGAQVSHSLVFMALQKNAVAGTKPRHLSHQPE